MVTKSLEKPVLVQQQQQQQQQPTPAAVRSKALELDPADVVDDFLRFMTVSTTVFHTVDYYVKRLGRHGYTELRERDAWDSAIEQGGKYFVQRNGSSLIAFIVGDDFRPGNGAAVIAGHVDALTVKLKPISEVDQKAGYVQLGVAPYAGALNQTWWDRDLGIGGRVLVRDAKSGTVTSKLVQLDWPIARIPTIAPHFGKLSQGPFNLEKNMVPIIGLDSSDCGPWSSSSSSSSASDAHPPKCSPHSFASGQPKRLVELIAKKLDIKNYDDILSWELELFDLQPPQLGGLDKEFLFAARLDDKLCSYAALEALIAAGSDHGHPLPCRYSSLCNSSPFVAEAQSNRSSSSSSAGKNSSIVRVAAVFDNEEIGSLLRQGARSDFLSTVLERIVAATDKAAAAATGGMNTAGSGGSSGSATLAQTIANSFLLSADVTHAVNPNFLDAYLKRHAPRLNAGVTVCADPNGHMTTDAVSAALLARVAQRSGAPPLQVFHIRNDSRSGGTVGPMLSARTGMRAIDAGIPQLSMHSIRATTGALDPGLGLKLFLGFYEHYEEIDREFRDV